MVWWERAATHLVFEVVAEPEPKPAARTLWPRGNRTPSLTPIQAVYASRASAESRRHPPHGLRPNIQSINVKSLEEGTTLEGTHTANSRA